MKRIFAVVGLMVMLSGYVYATVYSAGGNRYTGLTSDTKPTGAPDNSIYEETDGMRRQYIKVGGSFVLMDTRITGTTPDASSFATITQLTNHTSNTSNPHQTSIKNLGGVNVSGAIDKEVLTYDSAIDTWDAQQVVVPVSAGAAVTYYLEDVDSDIPGYEVLYNQPTTNAEVQEFAAVSSGTGSILIDPYASVIDGLGRTQIEGGLWQFDTYCNVSQLTGDSNITINVYARDVGGSENLLFSVPTGTIYDLKPALYSSDVVQPAFSVNPTDRLVVKYYATTTSMATTTVSFYHGGIDHYSHFHTPMSTTHNQQPGLQGGQSGTPGEYYHLTANQYTAATTTATDGIAGLYAPSLVSTQLTSSIATHASATTSVHNFDSSGNAPAQTHGNERHTLSFVTATWTGSTTISTIGSAVVGSITGRAGTVLNGVYTSGSYSNPAWITALPWSKVNVTPTTVSGYGITDGIVSTGSYSAPSWITAIAGSSVTGTVTNASHASNADILNRTVNTLSLASNITVTNPLIPLVTNGTVTYLKTNDDWYRLGWSAGIISGGVITVNANKSSVDLTPGEVMLRTSASETAPLIVSSFTATTAVAIADQATSWLYIDYNGGTPTWVAGVSNTSFNCWDKCIGYKIMREGTQFHILDLRSENVDGNRKQRRVMLETGGYQWASGAQPGSAATRNLQVTSGKFWYTYLPITVNAIDTSATNSFEYYFYTGSTWSSPLAQQIDNANYNNVASGLVAFGGGGSHYRTDTIYIIPDNPNTLAVVYGTSDYTSLAAAQAAPYPASLPPSISGVGILIGRVIQQKAIATVNQVYTSNGPNASTFSSSGSYATIADVQAQLVAGNPISASTGTFSGVLNASSFVTTATVTFSTTGNASTATYAVSAGTASTLTSNANVSTSGTITGVSIWGTHYGSGANLTSLTASNITGTVSNATHAYQADTILGSGVTGTVTNATHSYQADTMSAGYITSIAQGGTGTTATPTAGAIVYGNGSTYAISGTGNAGDCFKSGASGSPTWGSCAAGGGYATIQGGGTPATQRSTMNFIGSHFLVQDDSGNSRTNITFAYDNDDIQTAIVGTAIAGQVLIYSNTTGTLLTAATGTGIARLQNGVISAGTVSMNSDVSGLLGIGNGGTGVSSLPGSTGNVFLNSAGSFSVATGFTTTNGFLFIPSVGDSPTPTYGITMFAETRGTDGIHAWFTPQGIDHYAQVALWGDDISWCTAAHGTTGTTAPTCSGIILATVVGTRANPAPSSTNMSTAIPVWTVASSATASNSAEEKGTQLSYWRGNAAALGGFNFHWKGSFSALPANGSFYIGLMPVTTAMSPTIYSSATSTNTVAVGWDQGQTTLRVLSSTASAGTFTSADCGANYPTNLTTAVYDVTLTAAPNNGIIGYNIKRLDTSVAECQGTFASGGPANTAFLTPHIWCSNRSTASACTFNTSKLYVEADN